MQDISKIVIEEYSIIAERARSKGSAHQRETICKGIYNHISENYKFVDGYIDEADLGLGCGIPAVYANINHGEIVVDLGCAAGIDCFIAAKFTGQTGRVLGMDLTQDLLQLGNSISRKYEIKNVEFINADITNIPIKENSVDVIISNGVFSLIPNKRKVFEEMFRVLKMGGRFCISDITINGEFSDQIYNQILTYTGCLNGISTLQFYSELLIHAGFKNISLKEKRNIETPSSILINTDIKNRNLAPIQYESDLAIVTLTGNK